jgi:8-oxo-dGTP pyrophosphatase MutT (NUDIX family)
VVHKDHFALIVPYDGKKFHLVKQYRYATKEYSIEFPQGKHEHDSTSHPDNLAQAELAEETGFRAESMRQIGFMYEAPGYSDQGFYIYLATNLKAGDKKPDITEADLQDVLMTKKQLEKAIANGDITDAPTIAAYGLVKIKGMD